jgi:anti-sigma B factor antagonist
MIDLDQLKKADLFILNLQYVSFIDSAGIGALVETYRCLDSHGKSLCLINLQSNLKRVLEISEIENLFPIFDSVTEARSHFLY